jgi:hypothetical protein
MGHPRCGWPGLHYRIMQYSAKPSGVLRVDIQRYAFDRFGVLRGVGAGFEHGRRAWHRFELPVRVGVGADGALIDDIADDDVAIGVGAFKDNRAAFRTGETAAAAGAVVLVATINFASGSMGSPWNFKSVMRLASVATTAPSLSNFDGWLRSI